MVKTAKAVTRCAERQAGGGGDPVSQSAVRAEGARAELVLAETATMMMMMMVMVVVKKVMLRRCC